MKHYDKLISILHHRIKTANESKYLITEMAGSILYDASGNGNHIDMHQILENMGLKQNEINNVLIEFWLNNSRASKILLNGKRNN